MKARAEIDPAMAFSAEIEFITCVTSTRRDRNSLAEAALFPGKRSAREAEQLIRLPVSCSRFTQQGATSAHDFPGMVTTSLIVAFPPDL